MPARDSYPTEIEDVTENNGFQLKRLQVVGGWVLFIRDTEQSMSYSEFVADPNHEWVLSSE